MSRIPYAAEQLLSDLRELNPDATIEHYSEPDGLDVVRAIKLDTDTSVDHADTIEIALADDPRISLVSYDGDHIIVTFVSSSREADSREPFALAPVAAVEPVPVLTASPGDDFTDDAPDAPESAPESDVDAD